MTGLSCSSSCLSTPVFHDLPEDPATPARMTALASSWPCPLGSSPGVGGPARDHPFRRLAGDRGKAVVIGVVVQDGQGVPFRRSGNDQVGDGYGSVLRSMGEKA